MANLITEGFDWMLGSLSTSERQRMWGANGWFAGNSSSITADVVTGRFNFGKAMWFHGASGSGIVGWYAAPLGANKTELYIGVACNYPAAGNTDNAEHMIGFYDAVNQDGQFAVYLCSNGVVKVKRGPSDVSAQSGLTVLATSVMGCFQEDQDFFLEIHGVIASSGGSVEVRINTVPVISLTGANTQGATIGTADSVYLGIYTPSGGVDARFDDFYVNDTSGATNNSWNGNVRVKTQFMIADGATNNFSIGGSSPAASRWQSVLNQNLDDTKFVYSPTVGDKQLFVPDPNLNSPLVRVVQVRTALRQDDATQRVARHLLRIAGTDYEGAVDHYTNQTFTMYRTRWELNPNTGVSFTGADVNGLEAGLKVQA